MDPYNLFLQVTWIAGLAFVLAALSYAAWRAAFEHQRYWSVVTRPGYQMALYTGGVLIFGSLRLQATNKLVGTVWIVIYCLLLFLLSQASSAWRKAKAKG